MGFDGGIIGLFVVAVRSAERQRIKHDADEQNGQSENGSRGHGTGIRNARLEIVLGDVVLR